jgi:hypothetical protein
MASLFLMVEVITNGIVTAVIAGRMTVVEPTGMVIMRRRHASLSVSDTTITLPEFWGSLVEWRLDRR